jgi:drug/metabolite transporter (DMT)-like permease
MVLLDWLRPGGQPPGRQVILGLALGLAGVVLLVGPGSLMGSERVHPVGAIVLVLASLSWAFGSIYSRYASKPATAILATAMQMMAGGFGLLLTATVAGEFARFDPSAVSSRSFFALLYLLVFGSFVGFTAYAWLLRASTPARVSTYAYVNPVVAVVLGWAIAGEALTGRMVAAAAVIVAGVALITLSPKPTPSAPVPPDCCGPSEDIRQERRGPVRAAAAGVARFAGQITGAPQRARSRRLVIGQGHEEQSDKALNRRI